MSDSRDFSRGKCCETCAHWDTAAPHPDAFAPCAAPMSEALIGWFKSEGINIKTPALMKRFDAGSECKVYRHARALK